jgi:hypothetical protein
MPFDDQSFESALLLQPCTTSNALGLGMSVSLYPVVFYMAEVDRLSFLSPLEIS